MWTEWSLLEMWNLHFNRKWKSFSRVTLWETLFCPFLSMCSPDSVSKPYGNWVFIYFISKPSFIFYIKTIRNKIEQIQHGCSETVKLDISHFYENSLILQNIECSNITLLVVQADKQERSTNHFLI